ncbi:MULTISPECIES: hypothetical protein [Pseudanabaena]|jgi:hypothetical protein|uniref:hypothetical protein n=1 Tax=Pseudanabaena TaxID=1152 RepID=UPI002478FE9B|nr:MULTISPECIES: hypothetical protein [Pseudanabaena]MEA5485987.1 hypothetical protein [Pseudanabaena sp. CCNP1317]WGS72988.1 hypothetical protein OA858_02885 [Pseudanabaena galeata CCNP1313]
MSREVIQDFLHSAGVVGIALTNRRMRPYFYGLNAVEIRTKQALGQGVLQVVENVPEGFESFEFHFSGHVVFIYKLTHGLVLLVLTDSDLKVVDYRRGITKIKYLIETDTYNTVAYFKLLLGSVTQHSLPSSNWKASEANANIQATGQESSTIQSFTNPTVHPKSEDIPSTVNARTQTDKQHKAISNTRASTTASNTNLRASSTASTTGQSQSNPNKPQTPPTSAATSSVSTPTNRAGVNNNPTKVTDSPTKSVSAKTDPQEYKLDELLSALNKLSHFTTQYLGKVVVTNYWKSTRPASSWLAEFEVDRSGQISYPKQAAIACTPEQIQQIQAWVSAYIKRCKQVIRNFDQMLEQDCLSDRQRQILL